MLQKSANMGSLRYGYPEKEFVGAIWSGGILIGVKISFWNVFYVVNNYRTKKHTTKIQEVNRG